MSLPPGSLQDPKLRSFLGKLVLAKESHGEENNIPHTYRTTSMITGESDQNRFRQAPRALAPRWPLSAGASRSRPETVDKRQLYPFGLQSQLRRWDLGAWVPGHTEPEEVRIHRSGASVPT